MKLLQGHTQTLQMSVKWRLINVVVAISALTLH